LRFSRVRLALIGALALGTFSCRGSVRGGAAPAQQGADAELLASLRSFESARREATDFARVPASQGQFGADPYALVPFTPGHVAGILRGSSELVLLDEQLKETARIAAPRGASALTVVGDSVWVGGELSRELWRYQLQDGQWARQTQWAPPGVYGVRGLAGSGQRLFVVEEDGGRLLSVQLPEPGTQLSEPGKKQNLPRVLREHSVGAGAFAVKTAGDALLVNALLAHELVLFQLSPEDEQEVARIHHDGPIWGMDLLWAGDSLWIAAVGVEDHPLDRTIGSFGNIDSFLFLYRWDRVSRVLHKVAVHNLSEHSVLTPKLVLFEGPSSAVAERGATIAASGPGRIWVSAFGSARTLQLDLSDPTTLRVLSALDTAPGVAAGALLPAGLVLANSLLDRWSLLAGGGVLEFREAPSPKAQVRLGEALFFTHLMAPWNSADGALSRFTCETCHFEGAVDGRTHHTGRGDVRATTKPLLGLFNNRPHFSRALDEDLSEVAHNEFRVAGANSNHSPTFTLRHEEFPWLAQLDLAESSHDARSLRQALMAFLMDFTPRTNPRVVGRTGFSEEERRGAQLFEQQCERCHSARLSTEDANSRQPFAQWESLIFNDAGPLVFASAEYQQTSVLPYVHAAGARTTSLRRLYKKRPYFTNGSAADLETLLRAVRLGDVFSHGGGAGRPISNEERSELLAFLRLL
jgi:hypothetical protein